MNKKQELNIQYLTKKDLHYLIEMLKKPSVCKYLFFGPNSEEETKAYFSPLIQSITEAINKKTHPDSPHWSIWENGHFVGYCGLKPIPFSPGNFSFGYNLDDPYWGQGIGTFVCSFLIDFGFSTLKAYRLSGDCMGENIGSRRTMEKNGFSYEGCQKKYWNVRGKYEDNLLFGLNNPLFADNIKESDI